MQNQQMVPHQHGIYVHVPFCATACDYCAFYQEQPKRADVERYLEGIEDELASPWSFSGEALNEQKPHIDTIFIGGGTPGLLTAKDLERLCSSINKHLLTPPKEWTIELAPSTVKADKIETLLGNGVNRFSMGAQSFDEKLLKKLGRRQGPKQIQKAYQLMRDLGCQNINLDMMFALPGQSIAQWEKDLQTAIDLEPEHISTYCLTFEEDTALWVQLNEGRVQRDEAQEVEFYRMTWDILEKAGYQQYEVSNFARPGFACDHNLNTWRMHEWRGFGPSASSQWGKWRFTNPANMEEWLAKDKGKMMDVTELDEDILAIDALVFGLRMNEGVNLKDLQIRWPKFKHSKLDDFWTPLEDNGYLIQCDEKITLTTDGRLRVDAIGSELLER